MFSDLMGKVVSTAKAHPVLSGVAVAAGVVATGGIAGVVAGAGAAIAGVSSFVVANAGALAVGAGAGVAAAVVAKKSSEDKKE